MLDPAWRRQTSYFEKLARDHPDELQAGLARLRADLAAGENPDERVADARARWGDAAMLAWVER